ncbi:MAG: hypothetical protein RBS08_07925, partial [Bdellovibrionales bacterium]|nr:hypothetical protein [Bdellovibrionales bacterium]
SPEGTITLEFPHLQELMANNQFDTVYHEHYSYLSLDAVSRIFQAAGLRVYDVDQIPTHGGSLRIYGCLAAAAHKTTENVMRVLQGEQDAGLQNLDTYLQFQSRADKAKHDLLAFLVENKKAGRRVVAYGAAAKGNTLLNYAGVRPDLLEAVYDAAPSKQNKFLPGSHIPIFPPDQLGKAAPDFILILPWNIAPEVTQQLRAAGHADARFVVAIPQLTVLE